MYMFICIYKEEINLMKSARRDPKFGKGPFGKGPDPVGPWAFLGLGLGHIYTQFQTKLLPFPPTKPLSLGGVAGGFRCLAPSHWSWPV